MNRVRFDLRVFSLNCGQAITRDITTPTMPSPVAVIDALTSLLDAEHNSMFRFLGEGSPYVSPTIAQVRPRLMEMIASSQRHTRELAAAIDELGGVAEPRRVPGEEQYLAYLSLKFLLPKLVEAKQLLIRHYENALSLDGRIPTPYRGMLETHLTEHQRDLQTLLELSGPAPTAQAGASPPS